VADAKGINPTSLSDEELEKWVNHLINQIELMDENERKLRESVVKNFQDRLVWWAKLRKALAERDRRRK
jgi:hypothetical protein